jgi:rhamnulokinase
MPETYRILAFDLGAESGRAILGTFAAGSLQVSVLHRFPNVPVRVGNRLYWDVLRLWSEMQEALRLAGREGPLASIGVDTWGVDFALLGRDGELLANPRHYRDPHTEPYPQAAFATVPAEEIFRATGLQFLRFNTLFQLLALRQAASPLLAAAETLLLMPDLFHFWLSGTQANEVTNASTTQCYNPVRRSWDDHLLERFGLQRSWFGRLIPPGTQLGVLRPELAADTGLGVVPITAPATHDTAAAVAATPGDGDAWCFLSSGTWSLMGVELPQPLIHDGVREANFTNEAGVAGTTRFLKNVMGLWLVQECRRSWMRHGAEYPYDELTRQAESAPPLVSLVDPDDPRFLLPADMPEELRRFCRATAQPEPASPGAVVRCALESLALRYRWVMEKIVDLTHRPIRTIHVVGGGSQNRLLNQMTADATGCTVVAGPVEATAIGNVLTQALGLGLVFDLADIRGVVRRSFPVERYEPRNRQGWDQAYNRFRQLVAQPPVV